MRLIGLVAIAATIQVDEVLLVHWWWLWHPCGVWRLMACPSYESPAVGAEHAQVSPRIHSGALPSREGVQERGRPVMGTSCRGYGGQGGVEGPLDGDFCRSAVMRVPVEMPAAGLYSVSGLWFACPPGVGFRGRGLSTTKLARAPAQWG